MAIQTSLGSLFACVFYNIIVIFNNNRKYMYFDLNRIIYFNIFFHGEPVESQNYTEFY